MFLRIPIALCYYWYLVSFLLDKADEIVIFMANTLINDLFIIYYYT